MNREHIVTKHKSKEKIDFADLVDRHQVQIRNTCYGFVHNREDAEDLAQDVFLEAYRSMDTFRGESQISTWLYRIAVNRSLNFIRNKKRSIWNRIFFSSDNDKHRDITEHIIDEASTPQESMEKKEDLKILHQLLDELPENQKIAYVLHKLEELPYKMISEIMNVSLSSVESLIFRANKGLKSKFIKKIKKES